MKKKEIDYSKEIPFIRRRCPHLNEEELKEAEERFREHIRICFEILEEHNDSEATSCFDENSDTF